jgi:putative transposase
MTLFKNKYRIESARLKDHNYSSPGDYYVTINTHKNNKIFGAIDKNKMSMSEAGFAAFKHWAALPKRFPEIKLDEFIIMPDHMHGIVNIVKEGGKNLGEIIGAFKSISCREIARIKGIKWGEVWQDKFHDRIIRDEFEYYFVTEYIKNNPIRGNPENYYKEWYELEEIRNRNQ